MANRKTENHDTPNGGKSSELIYLDATGQPVDETEAIQAVIHEYSQPDCKGELLHSTYMERHVTSAAPLPQETSNPRLARRFEPLGDDEFKRMAEHVREIQEVQKKLGLADNGTPRNS